MQTLKKISNSGSIYTLFVSGEQLDCTHTVLAKEAGVYTNETLINVATVVYEINASVETLPFTLVAGDIFKRTITQTNAALDSSVEISY